MKTKLFFLVILFIGIDLNAQTVNIPDAAMKQALLKDHTINTNKDDEIQISEADNNNIENIDISNNSKLKKFTFTDNGLVRAYLRNGNNTAITEFNITNNSSLKCVAVDDVAWSNANWTNKDTGFLQYRLCIRMGSLYN